MAKAATADQGVHRLSDMLVEEVSGVDRAANRKRFLVVKSEDGKAGAPVVVTPAGATAAPVNKDTPAPAAAATPSTAPAAPAAGAPAPVALTLKPDAKKALLSGLTSTLENLMTVAQAVQDATEDANGADALPPEMLKTITDTAGALTKLGGGTAPAADPAAAPTDPAKAAPAPAAPAAKAGEPVADPVIPPHAPAPAPVVPAPAPAAEPAPAPAAAPATAPVETGKSVKQDLLAHRRALGMVTEMLDSVLADPAPAAAPAAAAPAVAQPVAAAAKGADEVTKAELRKAQERVTALTAQLAKAGKEPAPSNAVRPGERGQTSKAEEAWPADMGRARGATTR